MITLSLCMIVKNEEAVLARCLDSVRPLVDEIIVVDTGSTDQTKAIAHMYTEKVYDFPWNDDFSAARNASFSYATGEYLLWLDADDVLLPKDLEALLEWKADFRADADVVFLRYHAGEDADGAVTLSYFRERILRRAMDFRWTEPVHEVIVPRGVLSYLEIAVTHRKEAGPTSAKAPNEAAGRNLRIYERLLAGGGTLSPRGRYYYGRELFFHEQYDRAQQQFTRFLQQGGGWERDCIEACLLRAQCFERMGQERQRLPALLESLIYGEPDGEIACAIGKCHLDAGRYARAVFWYELASRQTPPRDGFIRRDYYGYVPHLQLCVCYDRLGDREKARFHNERAAFFKPNDPSVAYNRAYFAEILPQASK